MSSTSSRPSVGRLERLVQWLPTWNRRTAAWLVVALLVLAAGVLLAQAVRASLALQRGSTQATNLQVQLQAGDIDGARTSARQLTESVSVAESATDGPLWAVARFLPVYGDDAGALRTVSSQLDDVTQDALPGIMEVAGQVSAKTFSPRDGKVDLQAVRDVQPAIARADASLRRADAKISTIDATGLVGRVQTSVRQLQGRVSDTASAAAVAHRAADLMPSMLGEDGPRRYLLLIQNPAEIRSSGGIPGSIAVLTADEGRIRMGRQGSNPDVPEASRPVARLSQAEQDVLPSTVARDLRDTTSTPDFPQAALFASRLTSRAFGGRFDGVISVDPVALASVLQGIGPIDVGRFQLTADNAVGALLNGVYFEYPRDAGAQDDFFARTARIIFDRVASGQGDAIATVSSLVTSGAAGRISLWSSDPAEQRQILRTGISGSLPRRTSTPQVGVYLGDAAGDKMQYYLQARSSLSASRCLDDDRQDLRLITRLASTAPSSRRLPLSVTGDNPGLRKGDQYLNVRIYAPFGGTISSLRVGDRRIVSPNGATIDGRQVAVVPVRIGPQSSVTVTAEMTTGRDQAGQPRLAVTPDVSAVTTRSTVPSSCG